MANVRLGDRAEHRAATPGPVLRQSRQECRRRTPAAGAKSHRATSRCRTKQPPPPGTSRRRGTAPAPRPPRAAPAGARPRHSHVAPSAPARDPRRPRTGAGRAHASRDRWPRAAAKSPHRARCRRPLPASRSPGDRGARAPPSREGRDRKLLGRPEVAVLVPAAGERDPRHRQVREDRERLLERRAEPVLPEHRRPLAGDVVGEPAGVRASWSAPAHRRPAQSVAIARPATPVSAASTPYAISAPVEPRSGERGDERR